MHTPTGGVRVYDQKLEASQLATGLTRDVREIACVTQILLSGAIQLPNAQTEHQHEEHQANDGRQNRGARAWSWLPVVNVDSHAQTRSATPMFEPLVKYLVICVLGMVVISLSVAFRRIAMSSRGSEDSKAAVKALTLRVALSFGVVALLLMASGFGLIKPHGLVPVSTERSVSPAPPADQSQ